VIRLCYKIYDKYLKLIAISDPAITLIAFVVMHLLAILIWILDLSVWELIWAVVLVVQLRHYYVPYFKVLINKKITQEHSFANKLRMRILGAHLKSE